MKIDLSNEGLRKIEAQSLPNNIECGIFDDNSITKLENLDTYVNLKQFSIANNHIVELRGISKLKNLVYLNLMNNSLTNIDLLRDLKHLQWLNVSGNEIKSLDALKACVHLKFIDSSDNSITSIPDLSTLVDLYTLNLNGNLISTLKNTSEFLYKNLKNLFLSNNAIEDLNEICYLSGLNRLESLDILNNPCIEILNDNLFDYRPFIVNWCLSLKTLDGFEITNKEMLKAEWLYSQGKGRHFRPGQHLLLIEYLAKHSPLQQANDQLKSGCINNEEVRYSKILEKQHMYLSESIDSNLTTTTTSLKLDSPRLNFKSNTEDIQEISEKTITTTTRSSSNNTTTLSSQTKTYRMMTFDDLTHKSSHIFENYDSRPIKPLNDESLQRQLESYRELTPEELEQAKKKREQFRIRSKTSDNTKLSKNVNNVTKPQAIAKQAPPPIISTNKPQIIDSPKVAQHDLHKKQTKILRPRSKTQHDIKLDDINKQKPLYNPNLYSPNPKPAQIKPTKNVYTLKKTIIKPKQAINEFSNKIKPKSDGFKISTHSSLTFQDLCATKIQAAWRGYYVRNKSVEIRKKFEQLKYKRVLSHTKLMRDDLNDLLEQQTQFAKIMYTAFDEFWKMVKNIPNKSIQTSDTTLKNENIKLKEKLKLLEQRCGILEEKLLDFTSKDTQNQMTQTQNEHENNNILVENNNHSNKQLHIDALQPPLKVRLQKLNEKCVTLKWDHNPDNENLKLDGYRVYINGLLRGNLKSNDVKALINGIKEAGEYRITVRAFNDKEESNDSNVVITRVKKKSSVDDSSTTTESADENNSRYNNSELTKASEASSSKTTAPIIMDKLKHFTPNSFNLVGNIIDHRQNVQISSPRKENNFAKNLKERLEQQDIASRISPPKTNDSQEIPFTRKQTSTHPIPILSRDKVTSSNLSTSPIDTIAYKPPRSPPRGPSPSSTMNSRNENTSSTGFDVKTSVKKSTSHVHKKSNSIDLHESLQQFKQDKVPHNLPIPQANNGTSSLLNVIKSAKFSSSEPNLSFTAHSAKSDNSVEYVRKSIQFDDDQNDEQIEIVNKTEQSNKENQTEKKTIMQKKLEKLFSKESFTPDSIELS